MKLWLVGLVFCLLVVSSMMLPTGPATEWVRDRGNQTLDWKEKKNQPVSRQPKHQYRPLRQNKVCISPKTH